MKKRTFWDRLQEAMRDKNIKPTQKNAGQLVGVSQPSVHKWKSGGLPEVEHVVGLAAKLNVCVEWLFLERGPKHPLDEESSYLLNTFNLIKSDRMRDKALAYIDALVDRGPDRDPDAEPPPHRPRLS